jgi:hypothetical protein
MPGHENIVPLLDGSGSTAGGLQEARSPQAVKWRDRGGRRRRPTMEEIQEWAALGVQTTGPKQLVWEIMSSRAVTEDDYGRSYGGGAGRSHGATGRVYSWTAAANRVFETTILLLILLNVGAVIAGTNVAIRDAGKHFYFWLELLSVVIFTLEYVLRLWCCTAHPRFTGCRGRLKYAALPLQLLDFFALLPFYADLALEDERARGAIVLRAARMLRVVSLLRLERQLAAATILMRVFRRKSGELVITSYVLFVTVLLSAVMGYYLEKGAKHSGGPRPSNPRRLHPFSH